MKRDCAYVILDLKGTGRGKLPETDGKAGLEADGKGSEAD